MIYACVVCSFVVFDLARQANIKLVTGEIRDLTSWFMASIRSEVDALAGLTVRPRKLR